MKILVISLNYQKDDLLVSFPIQICPEFKIWSQFHKTV